MFPSRFASYNDDDLIGTDAVDELRETLQDLLSRLEAP